MTDPIPQSEPVLNAAGWAATATTVIGAVLTVLAAAHVITPTDQSALSAALAAAIPTVVGAVTVILAAMHSRNRVTPLLSPRDSRGRRLVPVDEYGRHAASSITAQLNPPIRRDRLDGWPGVLNEYDTQEMPPVTAPAPYIRRPLAASVSYDGRQVAQAYGLNPKWTGKGFTGGIIELGGGFGSSDLRTYFAGLSLPTPSVTAVTVAGGKNTSDGPNGADGEVLLDIEVAGAVAPGAAFRVYFGPNTDAGFLAAIERAVAECDAVSISWGGPESSWDAATIDAFDAVFADARKRGVPVFVAAGDSGSRDGTGRNTVDFPASSPNVIGCGGTRLAVNAHGERVSEVVWDDNTTSSATGGGISAHFPGRDVPDVAGNADPVTGYRVLVDGEQAVIGGTSAVAPLYLGMYLALLEATGGKRFDFLNTVVTNPGICFDVTSGSNGGFRAGPGRDETTGFGVVDAGKLLAVLTDTIPDPVPPQPTPAPVPTPGPVPTPAPGAGQIPEKWVGWAEHVLTLKHQTQLTDEVAKEIIAAARQ